MTASVKVSQADFKAIAIVRDKLGRVVVDEAVFHDKEKLDRLRAEIVKNGSHTLSSNS